MKTFAKYNKIAVKAAVTLLAAPMVLCSSLTSCSDEPDAENYYSFTGQMMSEYLQKNPQYSQFTAIVKKAGLMDQLSAYGNYTCFVPNNDAVNEFLAGRSINDLTPKQCDTIAKTHILAGAYSTMDLGNSDGGMLPTQNLMRRNLEVKHTKDAGGNTVYLINGQAQTFFEVKDDSVENGIVQPVNHMIVNSTRSIANFIKNDPSVSIFYSALVATGLENPLDVNIVDESYQKPDKEKEVYYTGGGNQNDREEWGIYPEDKKYGYTAFLVKNDVLKNVYAKYFENAQSDLHGLYLLACSIYDKVFPQDVNLPEHSFENLSSPKNPLYRFMSYHLLDRNVQSYTTLTVRDDAGVDVRYANPTDWYTTMLPGTMIKVEHLRNTKWITGDDKDGDYFINRNYDGEKNFEKGIRVSKTEETVDALNGIYFYTDSVLKFDNYVRSRIHNTRIRMDFSTVFPEIMTNNMRMNGTYWGSEGHKVENRRNITNKEIGFNYVMPNGYLKGVKISGTNTRFVYRRPRLNFYSMHGDEMIANGVFDITFELPPFPFDGSWQIRLGFAPMDPSQGASRGAVDIQYDGVSVDLPLNMDIKIDDQAIYGSATFPKYNDEFRSSEKDEERTADFKNLKNKGYLRGPFSVFHSEQNKADGAEKFAAQPSTVRKILCTVQVTDVADGNMGKRHTMRFKNVSKIGYLDKEAMFDYIELVPSSVFAVTGDPEDDL